MVETHISTMVETHIHGCFGNFPFWFRRRDWILILGVPVPGHFLLLIL